MIPILHVVIQVCPDHQRSVSPRLKTALQLLWHSCDQRFSSAAVYGPEDVVTLPRTNPCGLEGFQQRINKNRVNAPAFLALVKAKDLGTTSHESILSRQLRQR